MAARPRAVAVRPYAGSGHGRGPGARRRRGTDAGPAPGRGRGRVRLRSYRWRGLVRTCAGARARRRRPDRRRSVAPMDVARTRARRRNGGATSLTPPGARGARVAGAHAASRAGRCDDVRRPPGRRRVGGLRARSCRPGRTRGRRGDRPALDRSAPRPCPPRTATACVGTGRRRTADRGDLARDARPLRRAPPAGKGRAKQAAGREATGRVTANADHASVHAACDRDGSVQPPASTRLGSTVDPPGTPRCGRPQGRSMPGAGREGEAAVQPALAQPSSDRHAQPLRTPPAESETTAAASAGAAALVQHAISRLQDCQGAEAHDAALAYARSQPADNALATAPPLDHAVASSRPLPTIVHAYGRRAWPLPAERADPTVDRVVAWPLRRLFCGQPPRAGVDRGEKLLALEVGRQRAADNGRTSATTGHPIKAFHQVDGEAHVHPPGMFHVYHRRAFWADSVREASRVQGRSGVTCGPDAGGHGHAGSGRRAASAMRSWVVTSTPTPARTRAWHEGSRRDLRCVRPRGVSVATLTRSRRRPHGAVRAPCEALPNSRAYFARAPAV